MKPGDCTRTGSLAALKIEHAASGNESWHCGAGRLTCASKFSCRYHWFRLMSCCEISLTQTCWIYQRVDCVVSSCLLSINIWIICLDSNWGHPQVCVSILTGPSNLAIHPCFYGLSTSYGNKFLLLSSLFHSALKCTVPFTWQQNEQRPKVQVIKWQARHRQSFKAKTKVE